MLQRRTSYQSPATATLDTQEEDSECCAGKAPSHDAIARRAYEIYIKTGSKQGQCTQNWRQAERELQAANLDI